MTGEALPDPATLTAGQLDELNCALCCRLLADVLDDRMIGKVPTGTGPRRRMAELWACAPTCATARRRQVRGA
ncbi:hypothetical protein [Actinacidiphila glaucinigra]|uniref:hypothetical protein n=1 Tax=Actinacidiphila glaucinigra TaxID=235986 RepID=UPI0035D6E013